MNPDRRHKPGPGSARAAARPPHRVRIIGGQWRRTPLPVADAPGLRPTPDRVRETLFNWLTHLRPHTAALRGLDLYAGSGALGLELASRGALRVLLVERDARLAASLRALAAKLGAATVEVVTGDALTLARRLAPGSVDIAFIDPPFDAGQHAPALAACAPLLAADALVYLEAPHEWTAAQLAAAGWLRLRHLRAGQVHAHLLCRAVDGDPAAHAAA
jgi:16S rRNA (guanine(966)-N(2))-methyltransferase RsmD